MPDEMAYLQRLGQEFDAADTSPADERVEAAIRVIGERFPAWSPSPAMLGYARAVARTALSEKGASDA